MKLSIIAAGMGLAASLISTTALAQVDNPWQVRVRAVAVVPDESAKIETIGGDAAITNTLIPELDISYFFTDHISTELILGTTKHKATAVGTTLGDVELGKVWLLPPTLTLQYHMAPKAAFNPYVGAGINYTIFYSESTKGTVLDNIHYGNSFGFALQAGADIKSNPDSDWFFNLDVKKVFLNTDVRVDATTAAGAVVNAKVDINPWLIGVGVGKRF